MITAVNRPASVLISFPGLLPNLLCIGAAKCGTTSLHEYLGLHPEIFMAEAKELNFFTGPGWNWDRGLEWYELQFPDAAPVRGETSHTYSAHPFADGVPERIASTLPEVKLLYIVGDPIERIISDWVGQAASGYERRSLHDQIADRRFEGSGYISRSRYAHQLALYLDVFPQSDIQVVVKEELVARPQRTMGRLFRFLGVDQTFTTPEFGRVHNPSSVKRQGRSYPSWMRGLVPLVMLKRSAARLPGRPGKMVRRTFSRRVARPELSETERERLASYLAPDAARLRQLTGLSLPTWPV